MKKIIALLIIGIALLQACQNGGKQGLPDYSSLLTGTQGVKVGFMENLPPKEIFISQGDKTGVPFKIGLLVENKGASDVSEGAVRPDSPDPELERQSLGDGYMAITTEPSYVRLTGASAQYATEPRIFKLLGKSIENPVGGKEVVVLDAVADYVDDNQEKKISEITATTCYKYQTRATAAVCIDPDFFSVAKKPASCTVAPITLTSQGAPVAVTKVVPDMKPSGEGTISGVTPEFRIFAANVGVGQVVNKDAEIRSLCTSKIDTERLESIHEVFDIVKVSASIGGQQLDCGDGRLDISEAGNFIRCRFNEVDAGSDAFVRELAILLEYGYVDQQKTTVTITKQDFRE